MNVEEAIAIVDKILGSDGLSDLQEDIFRQVWTKAKYPDIAETLGYDANYIKDLGAKIWKQLSLSLDEKVTKSNIQSVLRRWQQTHGALDRQPIPSQNAEQPRTQQSIDWGGYRSTSTLIGRRQSLDILASWQEESGGQLIAILGIAGIGKTILAAHLAESVAEQFEHIIWRSLKHPLSPTELLQNLLATLQIDSEDSGETSLEGYITLLLRHLRDRRCLIILDGAESKILGYPRAKLFLSAIAFR